MQLKLVINGELPAAGAGGRLRVRCAHRFVVTDGESGGGRFLPTATAIQLWHQKLQLVAVVPLLVEITVESLIYLAEDL